MIATNVDDGDLFQIEFLSANAIVRRQSKTLSALPHTHARRCIISVGWINTLKYSFRVVDYDL